MKMLRMVLWLAGMGLLIGLTMNQGFSEMKSAFAEVGWGVFLICAVAVVFLCVGTRSWHALLAADTRPKYKTLLWCRWISTSINALLPVAQIGGDIVRARLIALRGVPGAEAGASVVADVTIGVLIQVLFAGMGLLLLIGREGLSATSVIAIFTVVVFGLIVVVFYVAQHTGLFRRMSRVFVRVAGMQNGENLIGNAQDIDQALVMIYRRRPAILRACGWRLASWYVGVIEVWIALWFLQCPVSLVEAMILESLGQAVRKAAFIIPGGLGAQEGGFMVLGIGMGLGPDIGLALSLVKRVRELMIGIPAFMAWKVVRSRTGEMTVGSSPHRLSI